ncbi:hypothetical protein ABH920_004545 [Catenulispora sp. EB89]|uniref:hypothetical protein n=1 Tax=Catenulispora sp. EB89 TaxID=3156257 RepID=UPI003513EBF8
METEEENAVIAALDYRDEYNPTLSAAAVIAGARRKQTRARLTLSGAALATIGVAAGAVLAVGGTNGSGSAAGATAVGKNADPAGGLHSPVIKLATGQRFTVPGSSGATVWFTDKQICVDYTDSTLFKTGGCTSDQVFDWGDPYPPSAGNVAGLKPGPLHVVGNSIVAAPGTDGNAYGMTLAAVKPTLATVTGGDGETHVATIVEAASGQLGLVFFTPGAAIAAPGKSSPEPIKVVLSTNGRTLCTIDLGSPDKYSSC